MVSINAFALAVFVTVRPRVAEVGMCAETGSPCKAAHGASMLQKVVAQQRVVLKPEEAQTHTMQQSICQEVPIIRVTHPVTITGSLPSKVADPIELEDCTRVKRVLGNHSFASVFDFLCDSPEQRERFRKMNGGCLYVPSRLVMSALANRFERLSAWAYIRMMETSYFEKDIDGQCPSEVDGHRTREVASRGGAVLHPCPGGESGFVSESGKCVEAGFLGTYGNLRIYKVHGLFGLDRDLQAYVSKTCEGSLPAREPMKGVAYREERNGRTITLPLDFVACHGGSAGERMVQSPVTEQQLQLQVDYVNKAYEGKEECKGFTAYQPAKADTGIRFVFGKLTEVTDEQCRNCGMMGTDKAVLRHFALNIAPQESGKMKIMVCESGSGLLGMAYFPGFPKEEQIIFMDYHLLPNNDRFHEADVLAHEIGHRLNLYHTFQGGCSAGDQVADTNPMEQGQSFTCPKDSTTAPRTCGSDDPVHNYMNYVNNDCMCTFTQGQVSRIWQSLTPDLLALAQEPTTQPPAPSPTPSTQPPAPSPTPRAEGNSSSSLLGGGKDFTPDPRCRDTIGWTNGASHGCSAYKDDWCKGGRFWGIGFTHNYPDQHCCWCGKGL